MKDLYQVLGLDRQATKDEIRKAYQKLANKHHPDKGGDPQEFQQIQEAYDVLSHQNSRSLYDATGMTDSNEEQMIKERMMALFEQILQESQMGSQSILTRAESAILASSNQNEMVLERLSREVERLNKATGKVKTKGENLYQLTIDRKVQEAEQEICRVKYQLHLNKGMIDMLKDYEEAQTESLQFYSSTRT